MNQKPKENDTTPANPRAALVVGAGVAGIKAALDMAEAGVRVYLVDSRSHIGGTLAQLDRWFPNNHCGMCRVLPSTGADRSPRFCLRREVWHENLTLLPSTVLAGLSGSAGDFSAELETRPTGVDPALCIACGKCAQVCPVEVQDEFNEGLSRRKAIFVRSPLAIPNVYCVDFASCTRCGKCVETCPTKAVNLDSKAKRRSVGVGAVILTAGFEEFTASSMGQYGHKRWKNVITGIEFERMLGMAGARGAAIGRPSDGKKPKRIAFLQCVGSRDEERPYCSASCCMFALKEGMIAREMDQTLEAHIFAMDYRAFGKGYHRYMLDAEKAGVRLRRARVPAIREVPGAGDLEIAVALDDGSRAYERFDMVVLSTGFTPPPGAKELFEAAGVKAGPHGFCGTAAFAAVDTSRPGVFAAGPISQPRDIPDSTLLASAAAARALSVLGLPAETPEQEPALDLSETAAKAGADASARVVETGPAAAVILCGCGGDLSASLDFDSIAQRMRGMAGVSFVETVSALCTGDAANAAARRAAEAGANRIVFGACVPYRFAAMFRKAAVGEGFHGSLVETVNLKEGVAWVHEGVAAREKAIGMLGMAVGRLALEVQGTVSTIPVSRAVLVAGAGASGATAALALAGAGFEVHVVEKSGAAGGRAVDPVPAVCEQGAAEYGKSLAVRLAGSPGVHLYTSSEWTSIEGCAGDFTSKIRTPGGEIRIRHGAAIVAVGGERVAVKSNLVGAHPSAMTHAQFAAGLASGRIDAAKAGTVAFFLCADMRDSNRPWCGRGCCAEALGVIDTLLAKNPSAAVWVFFRDMMTYGFAEEEYRRLRERGVMFVRHEAGAAPAIKPEGRGVTVVFKDEPSGATLTVAADFAVSTAGFGPPRAGELADMLGVPLDDDGFFCTADVKFRPSDFLKDGLFVAGLAQSPRTLSESVASGLAAAGRVMSLLSRGSMESSSAAVSEVDTRRCSTCETCISVCPFDARFKDEETGEIVVREALCQGCGACQAACPNDAAKISGFKNRQVSSMIDAALGI